MIHLNDISDAKYTVYFSEVVITMKLNYLYFERVLLKINSDLVRGYTISVHIAYLFHLPVYLYILMPHSLIDGRSRMLGTS
jgi:hypothetical protein